MFPISSHIVCVFYPEFPCQVNLYHFLKWAGSCACIAIYWPVSSHYLNHNSNSTHELKQLAVSLLLGKETGGRNQLNFKWSNVQRLNVALVSRCYCMHNGYTHINLLNQKPSLTHSSWVSILQLWAKLFMKLLTASASYHLHTIASIVYS